MKFIICMERVYRLSDRNYWRLMRLIAKDQEYDLDTLGTAIGSIDKNITDLEPGDAQMELDWKKSERAED